MTFNKFKGTFFNRKGLSLLIPIIGLLCSIMDLVIHLAANNDYFHPIIITGLWLSVLFTDLKPFLKKD